MKAYLCEKCGNIFEVIRDSAIVPNCCTEPMKLIIPNSDDSASKEKHVPVYESSGNKLTVSVGSTIHPMQENHYIEWIELETRNGIYRKYLTHKDVPVVSFYLDEKDEVINIYAYCNIHGLWSLK